MGYCESVQNVMHKDVVAESAVQVVFITSSLGREGKNFEHTIRAHYLSRHADFTLICPKGADFTNHIYGKTVVVRGRLGGKLGVILEGIRWLGRQEHRHRGPVILTEPSVVGIVGFVARLVYQLPWVVDVWDIPLRYLGTQPIKIVKNRITRRVFRFLYRWADLFIVGIRPDMGFSYYRIQEQKILAWQTTIWMPEQVDSTRRAPNETFHILCMRSNHNRDMGLDVLAQAFTEVVERLGSVKLWIVGRIDADVEESIQSLKNMPNVVLSGFMEHGRLMDLIHEVDLCVIPWRDVEDLAQTYPTKVMEYLTHGKVLIAPRIAGIAEMITDGHNGLLFTPGDHRELARKIEQVCLDQELRERLSAQARSYNERFDCLKKNALILDRLGDVQQALFREKGNG